MKFSSKAGVMLGAIIGSSSSCGGAFVVTPSTRRVSSRISDWQAPSNVGSAMIGSNPASTPLFESSQDNNHEQDPDRPKNDNTPVVPTLPLSYLAGAVVFVMFWPTLAIIRVYFGGSGSPLAGFDLDMFIALKGILDTSPNDGIMDTAIYGDTIMELPPLSPAEQLVGAIFGPP
jgi:hypothetical protein